MPVGAPVINPAHLLTIIWRRCTGVLLMPNQSSAPKSAVASFDAALIGVGETPFARRWIFDSVTLAWA